MSLELKSVFLWIFFKPKLSLYVTLILILFFYFVVTFFQVLLEKYHKH